jgi:hypothetical protein
MKPVLSMSAREEELAAFKGRSGGEGLGLRSPDDESRDDLRSTLIAFSFLVDRELQQETAIHMERTRGV